MISQIDHVEKFWSLINEILNAVLFIFIGREVLTIQVKIPYLVSGLLLIPAVSGTSRFWDRERGQDRSRPSLYP